MRQHVNPLSRFFQLPRELPAPEVLFGDPSLPIHLDIGSARGRFLLDLAAVQPHWNHLGVEIRLALWITFAPDDFTQHLCGANYIIGSKGREYHRWKLRQQCSPTCLDCELEYL